MQEWLFPVYRRSVLGHDRVWCPQWWRHAEAVARLESLWRAWEHLRQDAATGLSVWFRDHADHHMTDPARRRRPVQRLRRPATPTIPSSSCPHDPPPEGMFEPDELPDTTAAGARASAPAQRPGMPGTPREHTIRRSR